MSTVFCVVIAQRKYAKHAKRKKFCFVRPLCIFSNVARTTDLYKPFIVK